MASPSDFAHLRPGVQASCPKRWTDRVQTGRRCGTPWYAMAPRIYLVDDDPLVTESLGTALRLETDWEVADHNDARAALAAMESAPPDVVLSDLKMPAMGGIGFLARVRERWP